MKTIPLFILTLLFGISFISLQAQHIQWSTNNEAVKTAILDFIKTSRFYKKDSVFYVSYNEAVYQMVSEKIDDGNYKWVKGKPYDRIVAVTISSSYYQFSLTKDVKVGCKGLLPSRFIEKDGNLFYWYNDDCPLTEETLLVFRKYGIVRDDPDGMFYLDNVIDDDKKAMHYYFCKENLAKYKKVKTVAAIGYYTPPSIDCSK